MGKATLQRGSSDDTIVHVTAESSAFDEIQGALDGLFGLDRRKCMISSLPLDAARSVRT
jgi:hypothetical protein